MWRRHLDVTGEEQTQAQAILSKQRQGREREEQREEQCAFQGHPFLLFIASSIDFRLASFTQFFARSDEEVGGVWFLPYRLYDTLNLNIIQWRGWKRQWRDECHKLQSVVVGWVIQVKASLQRKREWETREIPCLSLSPWPWTELNWQMLQSVNSFRTSSLQRTWLRMKERSECQGWTGMFWGASYVTRRIRNKYKGTALFQVLGEQTFRTFYHLQINNALSNQIYYIPRGRTNV